MSVNCAFSDPQHVPSLLLASFSILFSFIIDYGIYKTIIHYKNTKTKPPKSLFMIGLLFVILSSITMITFSILLIISIFYCHHDSQMVLNISNQMVSLSYGFQIHLLHLLWLRRLKCVFHSTTYELSSFTYYGYISCLLIIWISTLLSIIFIPFTGFHDDTAHNQFVLLIGQGFVEGVLYAISAMFLSFLLFTFVYKLNKLYQLNNDGRTDNTHLISAIAKNIILASVSIFCTLILSSVILINSSLIQTNGKPMPIEIIYTLILIDIATNAICVMLTYNYHENAYHKLCGCIDTKCKIIYTKSRIRIENIPNKMQTTINLQRTASTHDIENDEHERKLKKVTTPSKVVIEQMRMASIFSTDECDDVYESEQLDAVSMIDADQFKAMSPEIIMDTNENINMFAEQEQCGGEEKL